MACNGITLKGPDGKEHCIPIYYEKIVFRWPPEPDPLGKVWQDISILVTINDAVAQVKDQQIRGQLSQAVQESMKTIGRQLPTGMSVGDGLLRIPAAQEART